MFRTYCTTLCNKWILKKNMKASLSLTAPAWQPPAAVTTMNCSQQLGDRRRRRHQEVERVHWLSAPLSPTFPFDDLKMGSPKHTNNTDGSLLTRRDVGGWIGSDRQIYISAVYAVVAGAAAAAPPESQTPATRTTTTTCSVVGCFLFKRGKKPDSYFS